MPTVASSVEVLVVLGELGAHCGGLPDVVVGDEGHGGDLGGLGAAADGDLERGAGRGERGRHVAHGDGAVEAWARSRRW